MSKNKGIEWDEQPLGQVKDVELAERLGVSCAAVTAARKRRKIPSVRKKGLQGNTWLARTIMAVVPKERPDTVPTTHLALMLFVGSRSVSIGEIAAGLRVSQSVASELVKKAEHAGRVKTFKVEGAAHKTMVKMDSRGFREMARSRKQERDGK